MTEQIRRDSMHSPTTELERVLLALVNGSPSLIFVKDTEFRYLFVNNRFAEYGPQTVDTIVGLTDHDITSKEVADALRVAEARVMATNAPLEYEEEVPTPVGVRHFLTIKFPVRDARGALFGLAGMVTDITERKRREAERLAAREQVIAHQNDVLRELSTPLIPIADGVLAVPLIGTIGPARADQILQTLLAGISARRIRLVLLDVTGVHTVDAEVARMLVSTARAAGLLGAEVVLTGISPAVALELVGLGVDLGRITGRHSRSATVVAAQPHDAWGGDMTTEHTPMVGAQELAAALDEILIFVALLARDGAIIWANRVALTLGGCTLAEVVGCPLPCAPWWATGAAARAVLPGALAGATAGEVARVELELGQPDERPRRYELTLRLLREVPARSGMILVKGVDVTEARQRETLREREEATYRAVVDTQTDIISRIAADGTILFVNDAYCQFFGRARAALVGRSWHPLAHPDGHRGDRARAGPHEPRRAGRRHREPGARRRGRFRWVEFVNRGFYDTDGRLVELQSIGRDITLRKEGEVERRAPSDACRSASASRGSGCSPAAWPTTSTMS
jgi:PAS domain S-box-containing protein